MEEAERKPQGSSRQPAQQLQRSAASNHSLLRRIFVSSGLREACWQFCSIGTSGPTQVYRPHPAKARQAKQAQALRQLRERRLHQQQQQIQARITTNKWRPPYSKRLTPPLFKETRNPVASPRGRQEIAPPPMHPAVEISEEADTSSEDLVASMLAHQVQDDKHSNMSH